MEEMLEKIKENWNRKITNGDTVYILGDVGMRGSSEDMIAYVATLKGHKILVRGNHDDLSDLRYKQLFEEICDYKEITDHYELICHTENCGHREENKRENVKLILCHYPILMWKDQHRGSILLYGHLHNTAEEPIFRRCLKILEDDDSVKARREGDHHLRAYNVGCMMPYMDYEPRTLTEIINGACR